MPCYQEPDYCDTPRGLRDRAEKVEAMLCAVSAALMKAGIYDATVDAVNETEAGVSASQIKRWWEEHRAADETRRRRERESAEAEAERVRRSEDELLRKAEAIKAKRQAA